MITAKVLTWQVRRLAEVRAAGPAVPGGTGGSWGAVWWDPPRISIPPPLGTPTIADGGRLAGMVVAIRMVSG